MLFVYEDAEKRKQFKDKYCEYKFVGPSFFIRNSDNVDDILNLVEVEDFDYLIVDISNWIMPAKHNRARGRAMNK